MCAMAAPATNSVPKAPVVQIRDPAAVSGLEVDAVRVRAMVRRGLTALTGAADEASAWRLLVSSNDVVGIKISTQTAPLHATRRPVVEAIIAGLQQAGVAATNIWVFDRERPKMQAAGYALGAGAGGVHEVAIVDDTGWDADQFYESKLVGKLIWGDLLFGREELDLSTRSHLPRLLTRTLTTLINVPALKDHDACGLAGCLYNVSLGMVDNIRRFETLGQRGDPTIANIASRPEIRQKLVLNILDMLIAGYAGGPTFKTHYSWPAATLLLSRDPVAIDALALEAIETKRREAGIPAIGERASHISTAGQLGLGQPNRDQIHLINVEP